MLSTVSKKEEVTGATEMKIGGNQKVFTLDLTASEPEPEPEPELAPG